jgi:chromosome segregation ATPase
MVLDDSTLLFGKDEGGLACDISPKNGEGEGSMQTFIRQHMTSILQPFADQVTELQREMIKMQQDLIVTDNKANKIVQEVDSHTALLSGLRSGLNRTDGQLEKTGNELDKTIQEKAVLEQDHEKTKVALATVDSTLQVATTDIAALQKSVAAAQNDIVELQKNCVGLHRKIDSEVDPRIAKLEKDHVEHVDALKTTDAKLEVTKEFGEKTQKALEAHIKTFEAQKAKDQQSFAQIAEHNSGLAKMLTDVDHRVGTQAEHMKAMSAIIRSCKAGVEQLDSNQKDMKTQQDLMHKTLEELLARYNPLEKEVEELMSKFGQDSKEDDNSNPFELLEDLTAQVQKNTLNIDGIDRACKSVTELAHKDGARIDKLEQKQVTIIKDCDDLSRQVSEVSITNKQCVGRIDKLDREVAKTNDKVDKTATGLATANSNISSLQGHLDVTNSNIVKLSASLDLAHEYFTGLGKGFRETHKRVVTGDDAMLPNKSPLSVTLPAISGSRSAR